MNAFFKTLLKEKMRLFEFVRTLELAFNTLHNSTSEASAKNETTSIIPTTKIKSVELHASEVYTRNVFS